MNETIVHVSTGPALHVSHFSFATLSCFQVNLQSAKAPSERGAPSFCCQGRVDSCFKISSCIFKEIFKITQTNADDWKECLIPE